MGKINVLLLEDVSGVGKAGDIVAVSEGYARNSLFPGGRAAQATPAVQKKYADSQARDKAAKAKMLGELQRRAELLEGTELTLAAKVKEGDDIYGSITNQDIARELQAKAHLTVRPSQLGIEVPIKRLGTYDLTIHLSPEVECLMKLTVVPVGSSLKPEPDDE